MRLHTLHELDRTEGTKNVAFLSVCSFTFLTNFGIGGLTPAFYILSIEFDKTVSETSELLLWPILVLGAFNFFWVPVANYFGKRPVFVAASGLLCVCYIWGALAGSFRSLLWSNIVGAFAGASTEALGASIVNDLFFLHERGAKMGLYMNFISGGNTLGPLVCGFVITALSWRWHKWISLILTAINFLTVMFLVPETRYRRDRSMNVADLGSDAPSSTADDVAATDPEKSVRSAEQGNTPGAFDSAPLQLSKKSWAQELNPWSGVSADASLYKMFLRPLPMFAYPCVVYAFLGYAVSLVLTVAVNILNPFVLQAPPYSWSPMINGLVNIPGFIGNVAGSLAGGWLVDRFCDWQTRRNGGLFEPEYRLYLCILPLLITGAGCLLFGYGVERTLHWTSLFFGYGMISFALTAVPTITMAYVSDCVLPLNEDALMLVNGSKNIVAFGFLYGIVPWVDEVGYVDCFGAQAGIFVAVIAIGMAILIPLGARIRHEQAQWRIIL
ncbi:major facilitator superfamily domain-containing protein [Lasiosphaeria miniovina]|uniref:Major facilitator superfamily domain-containing protein n=1 Tax=Lasiosphaeria miniovina TaxID=1954250 RepID=A0AA40EGK8_9PEZI|nr:major facilitator superfamily domain-containing protein [Lasiosphaeria miniovina]KAK0734733.1 major facilitator superfamily domain-containing protein [Lasiosphaeria miniovina]